MKNFLKKAAVIGGGAVGALAALALAFQLIAPPALSAFIPGMNVYQLQATRPTFVAATTIASGATTHFFSIAGSATKVVRVTNVECSGKNSAALVLSITAEKTSTADTVDAGTGVTAVPVDSTSPAATAVVLKHTTSPTSGTLVGLVRAGALIQGTGATIAPTILSWNFGRDRGGQEVILRGVAQAFSLNSDVVFGGTALLGCSVTWTEDTA